MLEEQTGEYATIKVVSPFKSMLAIKYQVYIIKDTEGRPNNSGFKGVSENYAF